MSPDQDAVLNELDCKVPLRLLWTALSLPIVVEVRHSLLAFHSSVCVAFPVGEIWVAESLM
jgi:hypothetical protein